MSYSDWIWFKLSETMYRIIVATKKKEEDF